MDVKLNELDETLDEWTHPLSKDDALDAADGVTLLYADGDEPLAEVVRRIDDEFDSVDDLETGIDNVLPTEAVGEPGQSNGEG
jgi:hypothetical protein